VAGVRDYLSLVKFSHSIFALPFALQGAWIAAGGVPSLDRLGWIALCAVCARTAAMAFNRLVDRRIDAENPRTRGRELPSGVLTPAAVFGLVVFSSAGFVAAAHQLGPWCGRLAYPVLGLVLGYSYMKRFSVLAHGALGLALACAPLGAWLAVSGSFEADFIPVLWLAGGVLAWVAGFDLVYACQDEDFDRERGLHSVPAKFGRRRALLAARSLHALAVGAFAVQGALAGLGVAYWVGLGLAAALLVWEHRLVRPNDLSKIDMAFFGANSWVGVVLFLGVALDLQLSGGV
jgi:4-hydroxybenzoate polyprenyltransferase